MSELPKGWGKVKFTDVLDVNGGTQPPKKEFISQPKAGYIRLLQIRDFGKKPVPTYIPDNGKQRICKKDDILIGRYGASVGRICTGMEGAYNVALAKVAKPENINAGYLRYFLESNLFQQPLSMLSRSAQNGFNKNDLSEFDFLIPPLNEQTRIANKLDSLLAKVDLVQTRLERIPKLLKRFRQSVLAAATSGELTREWRNNNSKAVDWEKKTIGDIANVFTGVTPLKKESSYYEGGTIPWLTSSVTSEHLVTKAEKYVTEKAVTECRLKLFPPGTLLVAMYGEGKTRGQVTELGISATINQACAALVVSSTKLERTYVKLCLERSYEETRRLAGGGNQPNLNLSKVRSIPINVPGFEEQKEIVRRVESLFAMADAVEKHYREAKKRIDRLTQSLLAKAFRGELVPQDPNDEPASELLKRIQAEREQQQAEPKRKAGVRKTKSKTQNTRKAKKITMKLEDAPATYLLDLLAKLGGEAHADVLWKQSELSIDDFYAKLKQEMIDKKIIDHNPSADPSLRKLKVA